MIPDIDGNGIDPVERVLNEERRIGGKVSETDDAFIEVQAWNTGILGCQFPQSAAEAKTCFIDDRR